MSKNKVVQEGGSAGVGVGATGCAELSQDVSYGTLSAERIVASTWRPRDAAVRTGVLQACSAESPRENTQKAVLGLLVSRLADICSSETVFVDLVIDTEIRGGTIIFYTPSTTIIINIVKIIYNLFRSFDHSCHPMVHYDVTLPE
jgi:hypothetical protein